MRRLMIRSVAVSCLPSVLGFGLLLAWISIASSAPAPEAKAQSVRTLYLVRHGDYDQDDPRDPDIGKALVPLGREHARLVAARLAALPVRFGSLHASSMTRARETATIIAAALPALEPRITSDLRECTPPTRREDVMRGLEPGEADSCRVQLEGAFARYFRPAPEADAADLLICHGNVIRYFCCRALGVDPAAWLGMTIANCSLTVIQVRADGSMRLVSFDDVGHLPPALQTYTGRKPAPADSSPRR